MTHFRWKFPDIAFFTTLALLLALMPLLSFDFGITWDEYFHQAYGKKVLRFYTSGFTNDSAMRYFVMHLYGGFYDLLTTLVVKALRVFYEYDVRHMVNAAFGWLAVFSAGMLARKLFNAWAGLAAVLLLVITPRFFAHCMNNPKDIPFAAMFMLSLYALSFVREHYPYVNRKNCLFMIGAIALTLNIRVGGLLLLAYAGGWLSVQMFFDRKALDCSRLLRVGGVFAGCCVLTITLGTLFWPWALQNPLVRPFQALREMGHFPAEFLELFQGQIINTLHLPWHYSLTWLGITLPLGFITLFALSPLLLAKTPQRRAGYALLVATLFPIAYVIATHAVLYNATRHLLFIYAPMAVLAAGSVARLLEMGKRRKIWWVLTVCVAVAGFYHPLLFQLREHPNQIVYFNQLIGGTKAAFNRYDLDYWGNSYKQGVDILNDMAVKHGRPIHFTAGMAGHVAAQYAQRFPMLFPKEFGQGDFHLELVLGIDMQPLFSEGKVLSTLEVDSAPILLIKQDVVVPPKKEASATTTPENW